MMKLIAAAVMHLGLKACGGSSRWAARLVAALVVCTGGNNALVEWLS
jgi:hypothetical protein